MQNILKNSGLALLHCSSYNRWQYDQFHRYVGGRVLEIGCGLGNLTQYLSRTASYLLSVDIKQEAVDFVRQRFRTQPNVHVACLDVFTEGPGVFSDIRFDTIVLSNVLEHISDDLHALSVCSRILRNSKGILLLLVPAHTFLYGTLDRECGHFRRYEKHDIIRLSEQSHFRIRDLYAFNLFGAIGWYINYCLLKRKHTNTDSTSFQMRVYDTLFVVPGRFLESYVRPKVGLSYIAILEAQS